jgi:hypothetical protein
VAVGDAMAALLRLDRCSVFTAGTTMARRWSRAGEGERGLTDSVRPRWSRNVGDAVKSPRRRCALVAGSGLQANLQHGEEA